MPGFLSVCLNPTFQRTLVLPSLSVGEVNRAASARFDVSGKGVNVCRVLSQLGSQPRNLTHLGTGSGLFQKMCLDEGLIIESFPSVSPVRTCITLIDKQNTSTTELVEPAQPVEESATSKATELFKSLLGWADWVIISGSRAPGYPDCLYADFCDLARKAGVPVLADYRGQELVKSLKHEPEIIKINLVEFCTTFLPELEINEHKDAHALEAAEKKLVELSRYRTRYAITRGARDCLIAEQGRVHRIKVPGNTQPIVNTTGSGDAMAAGLALAFAEGLSFYESVKKGLECGCKNAQCLKPGSIIE